MKWTHFRNESILFLKKAKIISVRYIARSQMQELSLTQDHFRSHRSLKDDLIDFIYYIYSKTTQFLNPLKRYRAYELTDRRTKFIGETAALFKNLNTEMHIV